jgi:hypothetical protein
MRKIYCLTSSKKTTKSKKYKLNLQKKRLFFEILTKNNLISLVFIVVISDSVDINSQSQSQPSTALLAPTTTNPLPTTPLATANNNTNLGSLDYPWEEGITENGERYYINHLTRTTT